MTGRDEPNAKRRARVGRVIAFDVVISGAAGVSIAPRAECDWPVHLDPATPTLDASGRAVVRVSSLVLGPIGATVPVSIDVTSDARVAMIDEGARSDGAPSAGGESGGGACAHLVVEMLALDEQDLNEDGVVDARDLAIFRAWWLAGDKRADFNADGFVNADDHDLFSERFEETRPADHGSSDERDAHSPE